VALVEHGFVAVVIPVLAVKVLAGLVALMDSAGQHALVVHNLILGAMGGLMGVVVAQDVFVVGAVSGGQEQYALFGPELHDPFHQLAREIYNGFIHTTP